MRVGVKILPRKEVLDTQGRAVERVLQQSGHNEVQCRIGKYIELDVPAKDTEEAKSKIKDMADYVLYNPLIESYELEVYE